MKVNQSPGEALAASSGERQSSSELNIPVTNIVIYNQVQYIISARHSRSYPR